jgi:hypothetical protein
VIGGIVVGFEGYLSYNTANKAGANSSRVVREPLLAEAMAAHRGDRILRLTYYIHITEYRSKKKVSRGMSVAREPKWDLYLETR